MAEGYKGHAVFSPSGDLKSGTCCADADHSLHCFFELLADEGVEAPPLNPWGRFKSHWRPQGWAVRQVLIVDTGVEVV